MCGIVGYAGPRAPKDVILKGLKALEYRGYDSAGVAILDQGHFKRVRAEGKLSQLAAKLAHENFDGHLGIGHTRWATHGKPSERNAHPHGVGGVSIVHNGIIENYVDLKDELLKSGTVFESETDSELVAHLIYQEVQQTKDLLKAVQKVRARLEGAYSIVAVWEGEPQTMVAFKNGPPLVLGVGDAEIFVASDVQAIVPFTSKIVYIEDFEIVQVTGADFRILGQQGQIITPKITHVEWSSELAQKGGYRHFMLKEIFEQPRAVAAALAPYIDLQNFSLSMKNLRFKKEDCEFEATFRQVEKVLIVACGTSYYAGLLAKYWIESRARIPVEVDVASEFRYRDPLLEGQTLTLVISQSGETADTLAALRLVKDRKGLVLSLCNVKNSSIDREADGQLYMNAGPEIGVASTKAFTATMAVLYLLALAMGKAKGRLSVLQEREAVQALLAVPAHMETVLAFDQYFAETAELLKSFKGFLYMGRGIHYPIALEGALKLKELAYRHAEGYAAGEMKHGPLALIDQDMAVVMIAPSDQLYDKTLSNLEEAKARGGKIMALGTGDNLRLKALSDHYLSLPGVSSTLYPLIEIIPLQLLAYHVAASLGHDVDQPRNLAKSVTVE